LIPFLHFRGNIVPTLCSVVEENGNVCSVHKWGNRDGDFTCIPLRCGLSRIQETYNSEDLCIQAPRMTSGTVSLLMMRVTTGKRKLVTRQTQVAGAVFRA